MQCFRQPQNADEGENGQPPGYIRRHGKPLELSLIHILLTATLDAARIRLRPILMTCFAFIMGCLPLAVATGAGAAARQVVDVYKRQIPS